MSDYSKIQTPPGKKRVGIIVDNYKVEQFKTALMEAGFKDVHTFPFMYKCTQIHIFATPEQIEPLRRMLLKLEHTIKRGKN